METIKTWIVLIGIICASWVTAFAQDINLGRARHVYELFVAGQGDSIHAALNKDLQKQLPPAMFNDIFKQSEQQFGKLTSNSAWGSETVQGVTIYFTDMKFERYNLRFQVAFDPDGKLNTIRLAPVSTTFPTSEVKCDCEKREERNITVGADGFKLAGTLTLPKNVSARADSQQKVPVVILVHGSGPNDRDESIGPNKPFRDFAWGLAERGIAAIRYDKRTKVYGAAITPAGREMDYDTEAVDDVLAAIDWVANQAEIASDSIYVLGHSLGGTLAPRIASRSGKLAGIIILAGLARPLEDAFFEQITYISSLSGASAVASKEETEKLTKQIANLKKLGTPRFDESIPLPLGLPRSYWLFANQYNPLQTAAELKLPILVLQGERDYQVTMEDFDLWQKQLSQGENASFKSYPKLNHLLQEGNGKATPLEYNEISSVPVYVLDDISDFVHCGKLTNKLVN